MRVCFVHPPTLLSLRSMTTMKPTLPIGLAYVAAAARAAGHEVSVVDAIALAPYETWRDGHLFRIGAGPDEIVAHLPEDAEVFAIGCTFSFVWPVVRELCQKIRARFPRAFILGGGEHFTAMPERTLREAPLDAVALGEGEETVAEVLAALSRGERRAPVTPDRPETSPPPRPSRLDRIPGIAMLRAGAYHETPRRSRTRDVDAIAPPAWDLFDVAKYNARDFSLGMRLGFSVPILATRGCPYQCTFCSSPNTWTTRWYARDPKLVVDEMQGYVERYGAVSFPFHDLTAVIKRQWIVDFCRELIARRLEVQWQLPAGTRCEAFDDEVARLMVRAGCRYLAFAPESGSERVRERLKKHMSRSSLLDAVNVAVAAGIHVTCFFMLGLPFDTPEDLAETAKLARELARLGVEDISAHFFHPLAGTELYRELEAQGRLRHDDRELLTALLQTDPIPREEDCYCDAMTARDLARWRHWIFANFYATRFATHPDAAVRLVANVLAGRETNKLEAFARELRMKLRLRRGREAALA